MPPMNRYIATKPEIWTGRKSAQGLYLHEKVKCVNIEKENIGTSTTKALAFLGYACDEGVRRNKGRIGSALGPDAIRTQLGKMPSHLSAGTEFVDAGTLEFQDGKLENIQAHLAEKVALLLKQQAFPLVVGGGHDIAYGHYGGIKKHFKGDAVGIINFDAHFDLRSNERGNNSGTPFFQIAKDCNAKKVPFNYLCLGIRKDANDAVLFETAQKLGVEHMESKEFTLRNAPAIVRKLLDFIAKVDYVYVTIDLDGFSSAFAPGVSAPSPMGCTPELVIESLELIMNTKKMISLDIAEMNPKYDRDGQTAKLAAGILHYVMHTIH